MPEIRGESMNIPPRETSRRPIKARETRWASSISTYLAAKGVRPNWISMTSVAFASFAGACLLASRGRGDILRPVLLVCAAAGIQLRLLCNLFDGMVAVEGGFRTLSGEIFNDLPDRIADPILLVSAGYSITAYGLGPTLGWASALLAVMTAYVRVLAGACGAPQRFSGPMAKQHRMALLTAGLLVAAVLSASPWSQIVLCAVLGLIAVGSFATTARRAIDAVADLERGVR